jgi:hypothetical protein
VMRLFRTSRSRRRGTASCGMACRATMGSPSCPAVSQQVELRRGLPGDDAAGQARYLEADVGGLRVASVYLPNGNPVPSPNFDYKLAWFKRFNAYPHAQDGQYRDAKHDARFVRPRQRAEGEYERDKPRFPSAAANGFQEVVSRRMIAVGVPRTVDVRLEDASTGCRVANRPKHRAVDTRALQWGRHHRHAHALRHHGNH